MKIACLLVMVVALAGNISRADEMSVATVDVREIFEAWEYSIDSQKKIEENKESLERENNDRLAVINQYQMERSKLHQNYTANQESMSDADKKKMDARFRSLGRDAMALEQDRRDFFEKGQQALANEVATEVKLILDRINEMIQTYALEKKFHMVVEAGGHTTRNLPLFVHLEGAVDITDELIKRLNETQGN